MLDYLVSYCTGSGWKSIVYKSYPPSLSGKEPWKSWMVGLRNVIGEDPRGIVVKSYVEGDII